MAKALLGPVLSDVMKLSRGRHFTLASAFYSAARLDATTITAERAEIMVRLNLDSIDDWVRRAIAPDALLRLLERHHGVSITLFCGSAAHAKIYAGDTGFLIGSANFTVRGLSGTGNEMMWYENAPAAVRQMRRAIREYRSSLVPLSRAELGDYVSQHRARVRELQRKTKPSDENRLPSGADRPSRLGSYSAFLSWAAGLDADPADEIVARANGKGQLSGHIRMNFYGLRQFLLAHPAAARGLRRRDPAHYSLASDRAMQEALRQFVRTEAVDEGGLVVDTWRTYLPEASGGKPKRGGGTSGNLNRMLPLIATYLKRVTR
jgi:hypothetical protein